MMRHPPGQEKSRIIHVPPDEEDKPKETAQQQAPPPSRQRAPYANKTQPRNLLVRKEPARPTARIEAPQEAHEDPHKKV